TAVALPAGAQVTAAANPAASMDELLQRVESVRSGAEELFQQRAAEYGAASEEQQAAMLEQAEADRDAVQEASTMLSDQYSANETRINELNRELVQKSSALGLSELFGLARQAANDTATVLEQSLITTQFPTPEDEPTRAEFLRAFAAGRTAPSPEELERVWF